jgi:hypothetical protein
MRPTTIIIPIIAVVAFLCMVSIPVNATITYYTPVNESMNDAFIGTWDRNFQASPLARYAFMESKFLRLYGDGETRQSFVYSDYIPNLANNIKFRYEVNTIVTDYVVGFVLISNETTTATSLSDANNYIGWRIDSYNNYIRLVYKNRGGSETVLYSETVTNYVHYNMTLLVAQTGTTNFLITGYLGVTNVYNNTVSLNFMNRALPLFSGYVVFGNTCMEIEHLYLENTLNPVIDTISVQLVTQTAQDIVDTLKFNIIAETPKTGIDSLRTCLVSGFNETNMIAQIVTFINCGIRQLDNIIIYITNTYYIFYETLQTYVNVGQKIIIASTTTFINIIYQAIDSISIVIKNVTTLLSEIKTLIIASGTTGDSDIVHYAMGILPVMIILLLPTMIVREVLTEMATIPMFCTMGIVCFLGGILPLWIAILIMLEVVIIYLGEAPDNVNIGR